MIQQVQRIMIAAALCGAMAVPACLHAQMNGMSCKGGMAGMTSKAAPAQVFNKLLSDEEQELVALADAMPADKFNYAPTAGEFKGVRTFASQVKHIASSNYYFFGDWNVPGAKNPSDIDKLTTKEDIMQALRDSMTFAHSAINQINADNAFAEMGKNKSTRAGTATHAIAHLMDHYGQLVVYLRMNGIVPPASRKPGA